MAPDKFEISMQLPVFLDRGSTGNNTSLQAGWQGYYYVVCETLRKECDSPAGRSTKRFNARTLHHYYEHCLTQTCLLCLEAIAPRRFV